MKTKPLLLTLLLIIPTLSFSQVITDGLVGYWPFNGNANDESGNNNHGTVNGATLTEDRFGNLNSAYRFDGIQSEITLSNTLINDLDKITIAFWIKPEDVNDSYDGLIYSRAGGSNLFGFSMGNIEENHVHFNLGNGSIYRTAVAPTNSVPNNSWSFIVGTWTTTDRLRIFINGEFVSESSNSIGSSISSLDDLRIGYDDYSSARHFNGKIDDIYIFSRLLDQNEIQALYVNTIPPTPYLCDLIYCDGENIGIGTSETHDHKLAVAGSILTEEIKVKIQENWPDYVFEEDYPLADLKELEEYVIKNKHLPQIPDAKAIKEEGYNLSELDAKLLEKIEELTLYIIEQEKEIAKLKDRIERIEKK